MENYTVKELRDIIKKYGVDIPSGLKKSELIYFFQCLIYAKQNNLLLDIGNKKIGNIKNFIPVYYNFNDNWTHDLINKGWAIVPINDFDSNIYIDKIFAWLESTNSGFNRYNKDTWVKSNLPVNYHGIFRHYIGHQDFMWDIREKCYPIFKKIWQSDDLICSFDGASFLYSEDNKQEYWVHCDQNRYYNGFRCIQGIVNLLDNGPNDGGLLLLQGSQHIYDKYLNKYPLVGHSSQFMIDLNDEDVKNCEPIKICAPAGHIILFDSRIFHCNVKPDKDRLRMCTYVSMQPISGDYDNSFTVKRIKAFEENRMTGHWCYGKGFSVNNKTPHTYGRDHWIPKMKEETIMNDIRKKLIGY